MSDLDELLKNPPRLPPRKHRRHARHSIKNAGIRSEINVTPLVDVVLVLLIIFMVVTPMITRGMPVEQPVTRHHDKKNDSGEQIVASFEEIARPRITFETAEKIAIQIRTMFAAGEFDVCTIVYNKFKSAVSQILTFQQLVPVQAAPAPEGAAEVSEGGALYEFEPDEERILDELLPRNLAVQVFGALLENAASEQGARMAAMDAATRNAGEMINKLTLSYNRQRQAQITKELMEIISGAEAV